MIWKNLKTMKMRITRKVFYFIIIARDIYNSLFYAVVDWHLQSFVDRYISNLNRREELK